MTMNEVATREESNVPAYAQAVPKTKSSNMDASDMILPRLKLMQLVSPEVQEYNDLNAGDIFHTVLEASIGNNVEVIPMKCTKTYVLWGPRDTDDGVMARSDDGVHWNEEYQNTVVDWCAKKGQKKRKIKLGVLVSDHGLTEFGGSDPTIESSPPIATLTYEWLFYVKGYGFCLYNLSRSGVKPAKTLFSKIEMRETAWVTQLYRMSAKREGEGSDAYYVPSFAGAGWAEEEDMNKALAFLDTYKGVTLRGNVEDDGDVKKKQSKPLREDI